MSEQEQIKCSAADSPIVLVEQTTENRIKMPFHQSGIQDEASAESHRKRSKAPAIPSVTEELKNTTTQSKERIDCEHAMTSEKHKHAVVTKMSSKRRASSPETITLAPLVVEKRSSPRGSTQPIPAHVSVASVGSDQAAKPAIQAKNDNDGSTEEIAELRTPEVAKISSNWSDDEEAGGLPRSESRASRVSRAVRQLFCCGVQLEAPSETRETPRSTGGFI